MRLGVKAQPNFIHRNTYERPDAWRNIYKNIKSGQMPHRWIGSSAKPRDSRKIFHNFYYPFKVSGLFIAFRTGVGCLVRINENLFPELANVSSHIRSRYLKKSLKIDSRFLLLKLYQWQYVVNYKVNNYSRCNIELQTPTSH